MIIYFNDTNTTTKINLISLMTLTTILIIEKLFKSIIGILKKVNINILI